MKAIAVIDKNLAIGKEGGLLFSLPSDMKHFREQTLGKTIVVGRKTLESFPGGRPLAGRETIVMSRKNPMPMIPMDAIICGGGQIYELFLDFCDELILTEVDAECPDADCFFPDFRETFYLEKEGEAQKENGLSFRINIYRRKEDAQNKYEE